MDYTFIPIITIVGWLTSSLYGVRRDVGLPSVLVPLHRYSQLHAPLFLGETAVMMSFNLGIQTARKASAFIRDSRFMLLGSCLPNGLNPAHVPL